MFVHMPINQLTTILDQSVECKIIGTCFDVDKKLYFIEIIVTKRNIFKLLKIYVANIEAKLWTV